jgi:hypothetical protein
MPSAKAVKGSLTTKLLAIEYFVLYKFSCGIIYVNKSYLIILTKQFSFGTF